MAKTNKNAAILFCKLKDLIFDNSKGLDLFDVIGVLECLKLEINEYIIKKNKESMKS